MQPPTIAIDAALELKETAKVRFAAELLPKNATNDLPCRENIMPIYKAPVEDVSFLLNDVFQIDRYDNLPGFSDASADVREAILGEAAKLSEEVLAAAQPRRRSRRLHPA